MKRRIPFLAVSFMTCFCFLLCCKWNQVLACSTVRVSVASDGIQSNSHSSNASISSDGRFVAFDSFASNLVDDDTNNQRDVFVHDRQTGITTLVSVASDGTQGKAQSREPLISSDGRCVAFFSLATNLVDGDTNGAGDVFVHDRQTGITTRVSVASDGTQGNDFSHGASISFDGRYITFFSDATNLVAYDINSNDRDVFVHDRQTGITTLVSVASDGTQGNSHSSLGSISSDGRYVAFTSNANNLVDDDMNPSKSDVFVHDRQTGTTSLVNVASDGTQSNTGTGDYSPSISSDGQFVVFGSEATNLVDYDVNNTGDVFVHDRQTGITTLVSVASDGTQGNDFSVPPNYKHSISSDGRFVTFRSYADNLVDGDTNSNEDIFVHDRQSGRTFRVSVASDGTQGNGNSFKPSISIDGRYVAFHSHATDLVGGDTNNVGDVFVYGPECECEGDFGNDGIVDSFDLSIFAFAFGMNDCGAWPPMCQADFDRDSDIDGVDLSVFAADFGRTDCP